MRRNGVARLTNEMTGTAKVTNEMLGNRPGYPTRCLGTAMGTNEKLRYLPREQ